MRAPQPFRVYFVRPVGAEGPVKIGCSRVPGERLAMLMSWSPVPLEIAATIPGDLDRERQFHAMFAAQHSHREWFHGSALLSEAIAQIRAGAFDVATLPPPKRIPAGVRRSAEANRATGYAIRLNKMDERGVVIPPEVVEASHTYTYRDMPDEVARRRAVVAAFVEAEMARAKVA